MKTKLVYVLTCAPDKHYIEQALMAVWSARHWNPNVYIVLIVDDLTDKLLVGKRAEILDYISEKIVVPFDDTSLSMMYRSRFIKTSIRQRIDGNFLFVDCDTIIQKPLNEIDSLDCDLAMVPDEHLSVESFNSMLKSQLAEKSKILGYDILSEKWYFNSGVMFAKDTHEVRFFWNCWHNEWLTGEKKGVGIDQPSLGKANILCNHIIRCLPDVWNTLIYMNPVFAKDGKVLHFWNFRNKSFLFIKPFLMYLCERGLTDYAKACVLDPLKTILPFDNILTRSSIWSYFRYAKQIRQQRALYAANVDATLADFPWPKNYNLLLKYIMIHFCGKSNNDRVFFT